MSGWQIAGTVVAVLCAAILLCVLVVFVSGVVAHLRDLRGPRVASWRARGRLDQTHPVRAVTIAWAQAPSAGEEEAHAAAHAAVRAAMPQLAEQLDRVVADARRFAAAGVPSPSGPCAHGVHVWRRLEVGASVVRECSACGRLEGGPVDAR